MHGVVETSIEFLPEGTVFFRSQHMLTRPRQQEVARRRREYHDEFETLIRRGQDEGLYRTDIPRAVLIAGPRAPRDESLHEAKSVLLMAGDLDARDHLREAAKKLTKRGKRAQFVELPGARHGEYGAQAEPTMESGLAWLVAPPAP